MERSLLRSDWRSPTRSPIERGNHSLPSYPDRYSPTEARDYMRTSALSTRRASLLGSPGHTYGLPSSVRRYAAVLLMLVGIIIIETAIDSF